MEIFISSAKGHAACNLNEKHIMNNQLKKKKTFNVYFPRNALTSHK